MAFKNNSYLMPLVFQIMSNTIKTLFLLFYFKFCFVFMSVFPKEIPDDYKDFWTCL